MPDVVSALERALAGLVDAVAGVSPGWLALGVALHLANQVARGHGWYAVVRSSAEQPPRKRDALAAWVAGAGAGGVVSARGGDAVRVLVLARRLPGQGNRAILTGTLVAETVGETLLGFALLAVALGSGGGRLAGPSPKLALYGTAALLGLAAIGLIGRRHPRVKAVGTRLRAGCAMV